MPKTLLLQIFFNCGKVYLDLLPDRQVKMSSTFLFKTLTSFIQPRSNDTDAMESPSKKNTISSLIIIRRL